MPTVPQSPKIKIKCLDQNLGNHFLGGVHGLGRYELSESIDYRTDEGEICQTQFVVISSLVLAFFNRAETFIFPSDSSGNFLGSEPLPGSLGGTLSQAEAITAAGWELIED